MLTKEQIEEIKVLSIENLKLFPYWRKGQSVFNSAYELFPDEANKLRGSSVDCFHQDKYIEKFLKALELEE